jgi:tetratricopeptide (TPR) repeat protein
VRDLVRLARLYHGLAVCHFHAGALSQGTELLFKAHTLYEAEERLAGAGWRSDLARVENDLGMLLLRQGDQVRAEEFFHASLARFEAAGHERMSCHALLSMGELRQTQGRLDESMEFVRRAISLATRYNEVQSLADGYQQLADLQAALGLHHLAADSFQQALDILLETGQEQRYARCLEARDRALGGGLQSAETSA